MSLQSIQQHNFSRVFASNRHYLGGSNFWIWFLCRGVMQLAMPAFLPFWIWWFCEQCTIFYWHAKVCVFSWPFQRTFVLVSSINGYWIIEKIPNLSLSLPGQKPTFYILRIRGTRSFAILAFIYLRIMNWSCHMTEIHFWQLTEHICTMKIINTL